MPHYHAIPPERVGPKREIIDNLLAKINQTQPPTVDWNQLFEIELLVLDVLPPEKLLRKAWKIRERYLEAAGRSDFAEYEHSKPPLVSEILADNVMDPTEEGRLRADLEVLLQDLFWRYRLKSIWEESRKALLLKFAGGLTAMAFLGLAAIWALYWAFDSAAPWKAMLTLVTVILAGAAGAFVSLLKRLDDVPSAQKRTVNLFQVEEGSTALILQSLFTGGIFALLLLLMFGSGLLTGELFPNLGKGGTVLNWLSGAFANSILFAKVVLWSFVAGFAERLVPDLLDTLAHRQSPSEPKEKKSKLVHA